MMKKWGIGLTSPMARALAQIPEFKRRLARLYPKSYKRSDPVSNTTSQPKPIAVSLRAQIATPQQAINMARVVEISTTDAALFTGVSLHHDQPCHLMCRFVLPTGVVHTLTTEGMTGESVYSSQLNGYRTPIKFNKLSDEHHVALNLLITGRRHGNGW